ncbi:MAG: SDR family NAD(P)-dependent oxidoreductase [Alphaproteobacteria bacterium]|nr:SDR family NAD(P)-dependent oxidoreductase [Alphaproteobacteria bacterium]MDP6812949.1 SDR family NAD(P)-dependent oxidoreductase [Alphaproteobacteria bacterium]
MDIDGAAALVTGGASGLGEATARRLAAAGARVAVLDMNLDAAEAVAAEIGGLAAACDVSSAEGAEAALAAATQAHGPARIAVNCAGIAESRMMINRDGPMPLDEHRRVIEVHLIGTYNICRLAAAAMCELPPLDDGERGVIVNTSSIAGLDGSPGAISYVAAKAGIAAMTHPMAWELGRHGIRVMTIAPGVFETPMALGLREDYIERMRQEIPFPKRFGEPAEFAGLVETIVTTPMLNAEVIRLDAGLRMTS